MACDLLPGLPIKAVSIQGSYVGNLRETEELLDLVRTKKVAPIAGHLPLRIGCSRRGVRYLLVWKLHGCLAFFGRRAPLCVARVTVQCLNRCYFPVIRTPTGVKKGFRP